MKILEERNNLLFRRKEIVAEIHAKSSPTFGEIENLFLEKLKIPVENMKIKKIHGGFGHNSFEITAFIYDSKEDKEKVETEKKKPAAIQGK